MSNVIGIFAKWPEPGLVKTRLAEATSPAFAAQVADALLRDTLDRFAAIDAERFLAHTPDDASAAFSTVAEGRYQSTSQGPGDLGVRLQRFFEERLAAGAERIVVIGTDSPTLPVAYVEQAFQELTTADVVLGPATDGGYYLVGCARRVPPIFTGIAWSTATVLRDTIARLDTPWGRQSCLPGSLGRQDCLPHEPRVALLPPWYDVDTLDDWRMLEGHVAALRSVGIDPWIPRTEKLFDNTCS